jgi:hypothetical protein
VTSKDEDFFDLSIDVEQVYSFWSILRLLQEIMTIWFGTMTFTKILFDRVAVIKYDIWLTIINKDTSF